MSGGVEGQWTMPGLRGTPNERLMRASVADAVEAPAEIESPADRDRGGRRGGTALHGRRCRIRVPQAPVDGVA